jgi:predicted short-subunit dehydrogenase-like oxidoreductase (DUF2520 family)
MSVSVSFAGAGNLAWHLAPALDNAGYPVREVYSRNPVQAARLVERLYEAEVKATLDFSTSDSSIFILAVSDDAIEAVAREIILPEEAILVHTSGSRSLSKLGYAATSAAGVLFPLQLFSKNRKIDFKEVPICVETDQDEVEQQLVKMGKAISKHVYRVSARQREALHVASVVASGFVNHMLALAKEIAEENDLDFSLLSALIAETVNRNLSGIFEKGQLGPSYAGDFETLDHHMEFLQTDVRLAELYRVISQHILDRE